MTPTSPKAEAERRAEDIIKELPGMDGAIIEERINREFHRGYSAASSRWIPVSERLPEVGKPCLGYRGLKQTYSIVFLASNSKRWMYLYEAQYANDITHWQYLLPPTEQP